MKSISIQENTGIPKYNQLVNPVENEIVNRELVKAICYLLSI
jgi:DNA-binding transcriptional regulator YhcF (GntR family)